MRGPGEPGASVQIVSLHEEPTQPKMSQYHFTPETYEQMITEDVPAYSLLQQAVGCSPGVRTQFRYSL